MNKLNLPINFNLIGSWNVFSGKDCVLTYGDKIKSYADRVFVVTGKTSAKKCGALDDFIKLFERIGIEYKVFDEIVENPHIDLCRKAGAACRAFKANGVLGIGGGSPLDAAKAVAVFSQNPDITEQELYGKEIKNKPLPIFACATTSGTGSEVTSYSIMTVGYADDKIKKGWGDKSVIPTLTFCDPKYTLGLPQKYTLSTAIDAAAHCIESYFRKDTGITSRMFAKEGLALSWKTIEKALKGELSYNDREAVMYGSTLAGMAIEHTGTCFPHSAGYAITTTFDIPHGFACAYFLPEFLRVHSIDYKSDVDLLLNIMQTDIESMEKLLYSVLPSFKHTEEEFEFLCKLGAKSKNIHSALYSGDENFGRYVYRKVFDTLDKYNK